MTGRARWRSLHEVFEEASRAENDLAAVARQHFLEGSPMTPDEEEAWLGSGSGPPPWTEVYARMVEAGRTSSSRAHGTNATGQASVLRHRLVDRGSTPLPAGEGTLTLDEWREQERAGGQVGGEGGDDDEGRAGEQGGDPTDRAG